MSTLNTRFASRRVVRYVVIALVGVLFSGFAYALLASMSPGAHTKAQYATIVLIPEDRQGQKWWNFRVHERSLWIVFPEARDMAALRSLDARIAKPAHPPFVRDAEAWAFWGESTHLGCWVVYRPDLGDLQRHWPHGHGGLVDPCHYGQWDMAGRAVGYGPDKNDVGYLLKNLSNADVEYLGNGKYLVYRNVREARP
jgi:Rieske Fe-S protein